MFSKISGATAVAILAAVANAQDGYGIPQYTAPSHTEATTPAATSIAPSSAPAYGASSVASASSQAPVSSAPVSSVESSAAASSVVSSVESSAAASSAASETTADATSKTSDVPTSITPSATLPASTASNGDVYVTSTVFKTSEITILSCKPEITDCPANTAAQTHTVVTTATVPDYVTVCPVTASLGVAKPTTVAPYTTLGVSSAPLTTFIASSAITTPEATSKPKSTVVQVSTETLIPVVSSAPGYGSLPSSSASSAETTPLATSKASTEASSAETTPLATSKASTEVSSASETHSTADVSSAPFSAGNVTSAVPTGSVPVGTGSTAIHTTEASVPGYGIESHSSAAETTPLATSVPFKSTGTAASTDSAPTSQGPFHLANSTVPAQGPTGPTGTAPVAITTTAPATQAQTVTLDIGGSIITQTVQFTAYETVVETDFVTDHLTPVSTAAVATTALTTAVPVTFTDLQGQEKTSTVEITHTQTLLSTLHLTKTAHITETVSGSHETTPVAISQQTSAPVYGGESNNSQGVNNNVATSIESKPSSVPNTPTNGECPACSCGSDDKETVTVTMPAETVYVTMGEKGTATASIVSATAPAAITTGAPYGTNNGTMVNASTGRVHLHTGASSGFLTSTKPAAESKASSTAAVPVTTSVKPTETPVGYGKRWFGL